MRSLVIKAKNKYENKRAKREDGGGKGVRILGRLEVIETHKRGIIAMLWIGIFWNIKETHHSLPRQTCFLLVLRLLLFLITSRRVDSLIVNSRSPSVCSRRTASSLVSPLPPSLPPYPSVIRLRFSLSAACSSSYFIPVRRWLALCARAYHPLDSYSSANLLDQSPYTPPDKQTRLGYLFHINLIVIIYLLLSDPLHSFFFFFEAEGTTTTELHPFRSTVIADYSP